MIVNFINPTHYNKNEVNENNHLRSTSYDSYEDSTTRKYGNINTESNIDSHYNICIVASCIFILYFILTVPMVFIDIIIGIMYENNTGVYPSGVQDDTCGQVSNLILDLDIKKWLIVNGIIGYVGLIIIICLKCVYTEEGFAKRLIKRFGYVINIFLLIWTGFGMSLFFRDYYDKTSCFTILVYNYLLIRMILAPLIGFFKLMELYFC